MFVNRYKFRQPNLEGTTGLTLNVGFQQNPWLAGQQEIIDSNFVDVEVENAVNEIIDYEKVKLLPKIENDLSTGITYRLNFLDGSGGYDSPTYYSQLEFNYNDFRFRKNSFTKSFLRLDFFDSDIGLSNRLLSFVTIFPKIDFISPSGAPIPLPSQFPVNFNLGNPLVDRSANGEGFSLYYFKDEILPTVPKELYMRAVFNNAKNGKTTSFMSTDDVNITIDQLAQTTMGTTNVNNLYTRYLLKRQPDGYYYEIDTTYSNNVAVSGDKYIIDLYEISAS